MRHCEKCGVDVLVPREKCPLCSAQLAVPAERDGEKQSREIFPPITTIYLANALLFRVLLFLSVAGSGICLLLNLFHHEAGWWSLIVLLGFGYMWVTLLYGVRRPSRFGRIILYQLVALAVVAVGIDYVVGPRGWALDYVLPALCVSALLAIGIVGIVGRMGLEDFGIYVVDNALIGLVPLVFMLTGLSDVLWPSIACVSTSILTLAGILIVGGKDMWQELKKRFHV